MWAVSVLRHGNEIGLSRQDLDQLSPADLEDRMSRARARLAAKGPHYIIASTADLIPVVDDITARLARGERP